MWAPAAGRYLCSFDVADRTPMIVRIEASVGRRLRERSADRPSPGTNELAAIPVTNHSTAALGLVSRRLRLKRVTDELEIWPARR